MDTLKAEIPDALELLAGEMVINVHVVWVQNRINEGWKYSHKRNDEYNKPSYLLPYNILPRSEKEYSPATSRETLKLILQLYFYIVKKTGGNNESIQNLCRLKKKELIDQHFGDIIESEYKDYLENLWKDTHVGREEIRSSSRRKETLCTVLTENGRELMEDSHRKTEEIILWECLSQTYHKDLTYYKDLQHVYPRLTDTITPRFHGSSTRN